MKDELVGFEKSLQNDPKQGTKLTEVIYKIRLASKSKGKGKSGGVRIITYLLETTEGENAEVQIVVTLLSIYDKSENSYLERE